MTEDWRVDLYRTVKGDAEAEIPDDFDEWLAERMDIRYGKGTRMFRDNDREVFRKYYIEGKSLSSIAHEMHFTRQYAQQVRNRCIKKLKTADKKLTVSEWKFAKCGNVFTLPISERAAKCLMAYNILTIKQLDEIISNGSIYEMRNMGKVTVDDLRKIVAEWKIEQEKENVRS